ncbi:uncharacterized protein PF11_0213-like isoform X2 [Bombus pyrosoma]|uniref:uncharacterized protein PF11_0213-like isoform X2 n=1 Tax=Bombus pyrosoma TaxID=396416 RepID=UPI001CB9B9D7|nr:uncharacterized protein PF11_0213-like isoform X2 [Bombus pyrosoma]
MVGYSSIQLVYGRSFIMKEQWSISNEKLISVEEGHGNSIPDKKGITYLKPVNTHHICEQIIQCVKLILYLELLLFVGWASYTIWQSYHIDSIEAKAIDNVREAESKNLFDQQSTFVESTLAPEELHTSEDKVVLIHAMGYVEDSHHDKKQPFNEEHDIIPIAKPDRDSPTKDSESSSVPKVDSAKNVENNESDKDTTVYNYSEVQDHFITEEPKQVENGKEENSEYYALLSLLLQNAMKTEPMKDHTTDSSINLQDAPVLSGPIYTPVENQEKEIWEYLRNKKNWYPENTESQVNQENGENFENLDTQGNLENQENCKNEENYEIQESEVNQENQEYQENQENLGILENQENQENLDVLGNQENEQSAPGIQESPEILENVETPILIMDDDYFEKNLKNDMLSMLRTPQDPYVADKSDDHFDRIGDMFRTDYEDGLGDFHYRYVPYFYFDPSLDFEKTGTYNSKSDLFL